VSHRDSKIIWRLRKEHGWNNEEKVENGKEEELKHMQENLCLCGKKKKADISSQILRRKWFLGTKKIKTDNN
jgi:hypothetical protein